jgi:Family of unknown function (DUF5947)
VIGAGLGSLKTLLDRPSRAELLDRCRFCDLSLSEPHSHAVDVEQRVVVCVCRACYLLFEGDGAARGRYRSIPERYHSLGTSVVSEGQWERLQIPVGMAFFFFDRRLGRMVALYPSPAGAVESLLPLEAWVQMVESEPSLRGPDGLVPDVEALLVRRTRSGGIESFLVPIDACYELTGLVRRGWKGFHGGAEVLQAIEGFFDRVRARCGVA